MKQQPKTKQRSSARKATEQTEHVLQFALMKDCFLTLQVNRFAEASWHIAFPSEAVLYPLSDHTAHVLMQAACSSMRAGWTRRQMKKTEVDLLKQQMRAHCCAQDIELSDEAKPTYSLAQFMTDMHGVWTKRKTNIMAVAERLGDVLNNSNIPLGEAVLSLAVVSSFSAAAIGVEDSYVAKLMARMKDLVNIDTDFFPKAPGSFEPN